MDEKLTHCDQTWFARHEVVEVTTGAVAGAGVADGPAADAFVAAPSVLRTRIILRCFVCGTTALDALKEGVPT